MALRKLALSWDGNSGSDSTDESPSPRDGSPLRLVRANDTRQLPALDRPLKAALQRSLLSNSHVFGLGNDGPEPGGRLSWRRVALAHPDRADALRALAAEVYGFRRPQISQVATYIYNLKLSEILSPLDWKALFVRNLIPVIEHGQVPKIVRRHLLASSDPGSRYSRSVVEEVRLQQTELVYASESVITELRNLLLTSIPILGTDPSFGRMVETDRRMIGNGRTPGHRAA